MVSSETSLQIDLVSLITDSVEPCPRLFEHLISLVSAGRVLFEVRRAPGCKAVFPISFCRRHADLPQPDCICWDHFLLDRLPHLV